VVERNANMARPPKPISKSTTKVDKGVDAFLAKLDHPHTSMIQELRKIVLSVDPIIDERIKWNSVSFKTTEWFGTIHLRAKVGLGLILHLGAKARDRGVQESELQAHAELLQWLGKDRAMVSFHDLRDLKTKKSALLDLVQAWIRFV
jgi:hypothetical protein